MKDDIEARRIVYADERDCEMQKQLRIRRAEGMPWEEEQSFCDAWIAETEARSKRGDMPVSTLAHPKEVDFSAASPREDGAEEALQAWLALASANVRPGIEIEIQPGEETLFAEFLKRWDAGYFNEVLPREQEAVWDSRNSAAGLNKTLKDEVKIARYRAMKTHHWSIFKAAQ